jgi:quercetin dioxygenase-like cupin family protein
VTKGAPTGVGGLEPVADTRSCHVEADRDDPAATWQRVIPPRDGSPLRLDVVSLEPGACVAPDSEPSSHQLAYVLEGTVELTSGADAIGLGPDTAFLCDGAEQTTVRAQSPARVAFFAADPSCDDHAALGERTPSTVLDLGNAESATGSRSFQVLLGPENGCTRATMFVGVVPPGAAPWHFHQYDEIVYLLDGEANYRQAGGDQRMLGDTAVRIPPRTVHINANVGPAPMRVLGVFTPAGSPSAAYLADDPT